jgi:hypothetical protein
MCVRVLTEAYGSAVGVTNIINFRLQIYTLAHGWDVDMLQCELQALFTGDHLLYSAQLGRLSIARYPLADAQQLRCGHAVSRCKSPFQDKHHSHGCLHPRRFNWDSVPKQLESVKGLLQHDFLHIFPGHGRQFHFDSLDDRTQRVHELLTEEGA